MGSEVELSLSRSQRAFEFNRSFDRTGSFSYAAFSLLPPPSLPPSLLLTHSLSHSLSLSLYENEGRELEALKGTCCEPRLGGEHRVMHLLYTCSTNICIWPYRNLAHFEVMYSKPISMLILLRETRYTLMYLF